MRNVAIMLFDQIEVLDFAGPYEVFNVTAELNDPAPFNVYTVAESSAPVRTRGQLSVNPNYSMTSMPLADILIIPGGAGSHALLQKPHILDWVRTQHETVTHLMSVCTGSMVLGKAGLLDNLTVTTHHDNLDDLRDLCNASTTIGTDKRYYDSGKILTAGGISAGIDLSLYLVRKLLGDAILSKTLYEMAYPWTPNDNLTWPDQVKALTD